MTKGVNRRTYIKATSGIAATTFLTGCLSSITGSGGGEGPIKFGNINPLTGAASTTGKPASRGAELAGQHLNSGILAEQNYVSDLSEDGGVLGRDVEIITKDSEVAPETGVTRARELVENDEVHAITGCTSSAVGLAVSGYTSSVDTLLMTGGVQTPALTGTDCQRTTFRAGSSTTQLNRGAAKSLSALANGNRVAIASPDSTFGHASANSFKNAINEFLPNAQIVKELYPAFGKGEYQNEIQEILSAEPDIFMTSIYPGSFISFINQAKQFDFFENIPFPYTGVGSTANVTPALGDEMPEMYSVERYVFNYPNTGYNRRFRNDFEENTGNPPSGVPQLDYSANIAFAKAIERAGSTETDDVIEELEGMTYSAPEGTKEIRADDHINIDEQIWFGKLTPVDWWEYYGLGELNTVPARSVTPQPQACDLA